MTCSDLSASCCIASVFMMDQFNPDMFSLPDKAAECYSAGQTLRKTSVNYNLYLPFVLDLDYFYEILGSHFLI